MTIWTLVLVIQIVLLLSTKMKYHSSSNCGDNVDEGGLSEGDKYKQDRGYDHDRDDDRGSLVGGGDWDEGGGVK